MIRARVRPTTLRGYLRRGFARAMVVWLAFAVAGLVLPFLPVMMYRA